MGADAAVRTGGDERKHAYVEIAIPREAVAHLRPAARKREMSVERLVSRLVEVIADDGLVDAVLGRVGDDA